MPQIITSDEMLRQYIPNVLCEAKGEIPMYQKLMPFLDTAEKWVTDNFISEDYFVSEEDIIAPIVVAEAYRLALPQLDVVLTPNGFATVGTQNLSPASKMRVDRLVGSLIELRDNAINFLVGYISSRLTWQYSPQGKFFCGTLFQNFDICRQLGVTDHLWDKYCQLHPQIVDLEASLAEDWFSPELMSELRTRMASRDATVWQRDLAEQIQSQEVRYLREGSFNSRRLADIVNVIRLHPEKFPEWHQSATAALFAPPVFRNDKKSSGYFF